jgi:hypothetical protein
MNYTNIKKLKIWHFQRNIWLSGFHFLQRLLKKSIKCVEGNDYVAKGNYMLHIY